MDNQQVIINPERTRFYCWGWDAWYLLGKLGWRCFKDGCRFMYVPALAHYRRDFMLSKPAPALARRKT